MSLISNAVDTVLPYKNLILAGAAIVALGYVEYRVYDAGYQSCVKDHAVADLATAKAAVKAEEEARAKEQAHVALIADVQQGGQNAVSAVYQWYKDHPTVKYVPAANGLPGPSTPLRPCEAAASGPDTSDSQTGPANTGPAPAGYFEIVRSGLSADCAATTIQALACRQYAEGTEAIINGGPHD
jgi:hypothetical protein